MKVLNNVLNVIIVVLIAIIGIQAINLYGDARAKKAVEDERARVERQQTAVDTCKHFAGADGCVEAEYKLTNGEVIEVTGRHDLVSQIEWFLDWQIVLEDDAHPQGTIYHNCDT